MRCGSGGCRILVQHPKRRTEPPSPCNDSDEDARQDIEHIVLFDQHHRGRECGPEDPDPDAEGPTMASTQTEVRSQHDQEGMHDVKAGPSVPCGVGAVQCIEEGLEDWPRVHLVPEVHFHRKQQHHDEDAPCEHHEGLMHHDQPASPCIARAGDDRSEDVIQVE